MIPTQTSLSSSKQNQVVALRQFWSIGKRIRLWILTRKRRCCQLCTSPATAATTATISTPFTGSSSSWEKHWSWSRMSICLRRISENSLPTGWTFAVQRLRSNLSFTARNKSTTRSSLLLKGSTSSLTAKLADKLTSHSGCLKFFPRMSRSSSQLLKAQRVCNTFRKLSVRSLTSNLTLIFLHFSWKVPSNSNLFSIKKPKKSTKKVYKNLYIGSVQTATLTTLLNFSREIFWSRRPMIVLGTVQLLFDRY